VGRETNKQRRERSAGTAREKAAVARAQQQRTDQRRRALVVISSIVVVVLVVGVIVAIAVTRKTKNDVAGNRVNASPAVVKDVTSISPATFTSVGGGTSSLAIQKVSQPPLATGKPELLYIGGEFCPICAAERWSMTAALARFGSFSNLKQIHSASDDGNLATLSYYQSSYTSKYLTFDPVENVDRDKKPLENLSSAQLAAYSKITGSTSLSFPFLDFDGKYAQGTEGYDGASVLGSQTQAQIASQLNDPSTKVSKAIVGEANNLTAAICGLTNNQPSTVCSVPSITSIQSKLNG
jgi:Domain of unknown function (DUF929)